MVEGDGGDEVVADVGADDVVEEVGIDEAEVAVDGCGGAAGKGPGLVVVMWHCCVGVLEECDGHCYYRLVSIPIPAQTKSEADCKQKKGQETYQSSC